MLDRVAGNAAAIEAVKAALAQGRLSHSVLLLGEEGAGAGFCARCLAADWLYPDGGAAAEAVVRGEGAECLSVRAENKSNTISVDQVRRVRREVYNTALSAQGRVVIFYAAHRMQTEAANALLKVLEEPPAGVLFLLTATTPAAVLPTIRSRCAAVQLSALPDEECAAFVEKARPRCKGAGFLSAVYGGRIGCVLRCLDDPARRAVLDDALAAARCAAEGDVYRLAALLAGYEKRKTDALTMLEDLRAVCGAVVRGEQAAGLTAEQAAAAAREAGEAMGLLQANVNDKLVFSCLAAKLCR